MCAKKLKEQDEDIRTMILSELSRQENSTAEFIANKFLYNIHKDLGTTIRALIELIEEGFVKESNIDWKDESQKNNSIVLSIDTTGKPGSNAKNPKRLLDSSDIKSIRLFITLKGKMYLIQDKKLKIDFTLSKWQKIWFWPIAFIGIISLILAILALVK